MRAIWSIAKRDIFSFFVSPMAYAVLTVWVITQGASLYTYAQYFASQPMSQGGVTDTPLTLFFGNSTLFYIAVLVLVPLLSMRLMAEETRSGTLEPLLTVPVTDAQVVLGKYLAALSYWIALWIPTVLFVVIMDNYGGVDWRVVACSYLGVVLLGAYYMGIGLFMSTLAKSQIVAAVMTFLAAILLFLAGILEVFVSGESGDMFGYVGLWSHMEDFSRGVVDSRRLVFSLSMVVLTVFSSIRVMQARRFAG